MPYVTAPEERYLVALARIVAAGEVVEVDDETAASLLEQGWKPGKAPRRPKASAGGEADTTAPAEPTDDTPPKE